MPLRYRVASLFAAYFFGLGLFLPFFPLVLAEAGLGAAEIGSLLALPLLIRLVANPLVSALADRYLRPGQAIALLSAVACAGFGALFLVSGFWPTALVLAATSLAWGPLVPISDALAARVQRRGRRRLRTHAPVGLDCLCRCKSGWWPSRRHMDLSGGAWRIIAGLAVSAVVGWCLPLARLRDESASEEAQAPGPGRGAAILYAPSFLIVIAAVGLVQASHAAYYAFSALYWSQAGLGGTQVGLLWGLRRDGGPAVFHGGPDRRADRQRRSPRVWRGRGRGALAGVSPCARPVGDLCPATAARADLRRNPSGRRCLRRAHGAAAMGGGRPRHRIDHCRGNERNGNRAGGPALRAGSRTGLLRHGLPRGLGGALLCVSLLWGRPRA
jgi:hypothetical protein